MGFDQYEKAKIVSGRTVPYVMNMLPGEPVVHVEWIGDTNRTWVNHLMAEARAGEKGIKAVSDREFAKLADPEQRKKNREENRKLLAKHSIRKLEAFHSDGRAATDDDIPLWVQSIPDDCVDKIVVFVLNAENFREHVIESTASALAEK